MASIGLEVERSMGIENIADVRLAPPTSANLMRAEKLDPHWVELASDGWRVERAMGIENTALDPKLI